jgi:hypothetical protein
MDGLRSRPGPSPGPLPKGERARRTHVLGLIKTSAAREGGPMSLDALQAEA